MTEKCLVETFKVVLITRKIAVFLPPKPTIPTRVCGGGALGSAPPPTAANAPFSFVLGDLIPPRREDPPAIFQYPNTREGTLSPSSAHHPTIAPGSFGCSRRRLKVPRSLKLHSDKTAIVGSGSCPLRPGRSAKRTEHDLLNLCLQQTAPSPLSVKSPLEPGAPGRHGSDVPQPASPTAKPVLSQHPDADRRRVRSGPPISPQWRSAAAHVRVTPRRRCRSGIRTGWLTLLTSLEAKSEGIIVTHISEFGMQEPPSKVTLRSMASSRTASHSASGLVQPGYQSISSITGIAGGHTRPWRFAATSKSLGAKSALRQPC